MASNSVYNAQQLINNALATGINKRFNTQPKQGGLLDFLKSDYAGDISSGLLARSGYTTMPSNFGSALGQSVQEADLKQSQRNANELSELGTLANLSKTLQTPNRPTSKGADGFLYYTDTGERVLPNVELPAKDRKTATDINGVLRYVDDGTQVFEGVEKNVQDKDRKTATDSFGVLRFVDTGEQVFKGDKKKQVTYNTAKDINDQLRYTEGPNQGDLVFPDVEKNVEDKERKTEKDIKGVLRYVDDGSKVFADDEAPEDKRETGKDIDGILRYVDTGEKVFASDEAPEDERKTGKDIDGVLRYTDTGEKVFPTDTVTKKYATAKDVNNELRYTEGPNIGERVFDVEKKEDEKERKTQKDINGVLRYLDTSEPVFPDVTKAEDKRETKQDVNGQWRYVDNGLLVFPKVTKIDDKKDEETFKRWQGFQKVALDKFGIVLNEGEAKLLSQSIGKDVSYVNDDGIVVNRFEELLASYFPDKFKDNVSTDQSTEEIPSPTLGSDNIKKIEFDKKVLDLSEAMDSQNYTETLAVLNEVKKLTQGGNVAGFGQTSLLPDSMLTQKGVDTRSAFATLFNTTLKDRSGVAVTVPELERLKQEFSAGVFKTDKDLMNALNRFERILNAKIKSTLAGYSKEVIEQYKANDGLPQFNLGDKYGLNS